MNQRSISATWVKTLCDMFSHEGLCISSLLDIVGIPEEQLDQPDRRFSIETLTLLWDTAVEISDNKHLGLNIELCDRLVSFYQVGYGMSASQTLHDAIVLMKNYFAVISNDTLIELKNTRDGLWMYTDIFKHHHAYSSRLEFGTLMTLRLFSWLTRQSIMPLAIEWEYPEPDNCAIYQDVFSIRPRFGQPANRIKIRQSDLDIPIPTANASMYDMQKKYLDEQIARLGYTSIYFHVYNEIFQNLKRGEPRRPDIAAKLHISDRTLQRKLKLEQKTFSSVVDEVREKRAKQYLADPTITLQEASQLLGFADIRSFYRFSQRILGMPPGLYRDKYRDH